MKKGYLLVALGASCWGTLGAISTVLFNHGLSPVTVANYRVLLTTLIFGGYLLLFRRHDFKVKKQDLPLLVCIGLVSVCLFNLAYNSAIDMTSIVTAVILLYTAPIFVTIISRFIFNEKVTTQKTVALVLTLIGCALVSQAYDLNNLKLNSIGIVAGLGAGLTYGLYSIFSKKALVTCSPWTITFYSFAFGSLFLSLYGKPWQSLYIFNDVTIATFLWLIALIPTVAAYTLYTTGLQFVETSKASIIATMEPVVAVILAAFIFHEQINAIQLLGILLVIGSVILIQLPMGRRSLNQTKNTSI
ncbi:EamA family transporter [Peptococcaceae bacterium 1198_IL3148]